MKTPYPLRVFVEKDAAGRLGGWSIVGKLLSLHLSERQRGYALRAREGIRFGVLASVGFHWADLTDVIREARDSAVKSRRFLEDTVNVSAKLLAKKNTASMTQEKRESFMARLRCPEQATASGKDPLQTETCCPGQPGYRVFPATTGIFRTTGYAVHYGPLLWLKVHVGVDY